MMRFLLLLCVLAPSVAEAKMPKVRDTRLAVAVLDIAGSEAFAGVKNDALLATISEALDKLGLFRAITRKDIETMVSLEETREMMGCQSGAACIVELANAMGSAYALSGSLAHEQTEYILQLQMVSSRTGNVVGRVSRRFVALANLPGELRAAVQLVVRDIAAQNPGNLNLIVSEEGATVSVDGAIVGTSPMRAPLRLPGGLHELSLEKDGFVRQRRDVLVPRSSAVDVSVVLLPSEELRRSREKKALAMRGVAWGTLALGTLAAGGSLATYLVADARARALSRATDSYNGGIGDSAQFADLQSQRRAIAGMDVATVSLAATSLVSFIVSATLFATGERPALYAAPGK